MRSTQRRHSSPSRSTHTLGADVTDEDIERYLTHVEEDTPRNVWNLSTAAGLGLTAVGTAYLFQQLGWWDGYGLEILVHTLPWLAGVLIVLIGFGVIARPSATSNDDEMSGEPAPVTDTYSSSTHSTDTVNDPTIGEAAKNFVKAVRHTAREKNLVRSHDRKISGVCGGLGEYFGIDPTYVRIGFVAAAVLGWGTSVLIYVGLVMAMPAPDDEVDEHSRVRVTRQ